MLSGEYRDVLNKLSIGKLLGNPIASLSGNTAVFATQKDMIEVVTKSMLKGRATLVPSSVDNFLSILRRSVVRSNQKGVDKWSFKLTDNRVVILDEDSISTTYEISLNPIMAVIPEFIDAFPELKKEIKSRGKTLDLSYLLTLLRSNNISDKDPLPSLVSMAIDNNETNCKVLKFKDAWFFEFKEMGVTYTTTRESINQSLGDKNIS